MNPPKSAIVLIGISTLVLFGLIFLNYSKSSPQNLPDAGFAVLEKEKVREPVGAGTFYPSDPAELDKTVELLLSRTEKSNLGGKIKALIVPHAGYVYSGQIAAAGFAQLEKNYGKIFVLGPSHKYPLEGVSLASETHFKTPIGKVELWNGRKKLLSDTIEEIPQAHAEEYSIENELPFLQKVSEFKLVPLVVGKTDTLKLKNSIIANLEENDLIVVSVDLSHYQQYQEAISRDLFAIRSILALDFEKVIASDIDAPWAVSSLVQIAEEKGWTPVFLAYQNSGDVTGEKEKVVGYAAIAFVEIDRNQFRAKEFSETEKKSIKDLARGSMDYYLRTGKRPVPDTKTLEPAMLEKSACFVSMEKFGILRGSVGHLVAQEELYNCIITNSINAAVNDKRFPPLSATELSDVKITVSVLTMPRAISFGSPQDLLEKIRQNTDGVILQNANKGATYLPTVWKQIPEKENFFRNLCNKAEMDAECWKDKNTKIYTYEAAIISE